jgi:hypothetical protein
MWGLLMLRSFRSCRREARPIRARRQCLVPLCNTHDNLHERVQPTACDLTWRGDLMRAALLYLGLFSLVLMHPTRHPAIDADRAIPRFVLHKDTWVCLDRNPRQLNRQDCIPRK